MVDIVKESVVQDGCGQLRVLGDALGAEELEAGGARGGRARDAPRARGRRARR